ncbi:MAG TPA: DUF134 domain-containing protein [Methanoregulaceae archaeon]|nr:DUF134 domain-containing protein [Methanoregulaceae archaeon]HQJ87628.1 DUF134 domain-containing protein [Methanoregulaceae archaeon]
MPGRRRCRRVGWEPAFTSFGPTGEDVRDSGTVVLSVDEYEAVRLKDLEGFDQATCATMMEISQPTFHRLVTSARRKVADALTHGKAIRIEGGHYRL